MMNFLVKIIITVICSVLFCVSAQKLEAEDVPNPEEGICQSIDARNDPSALEKIRNCTVIVGSLQVTLMERASEGDYDDYVFPKLREVTQFMLVYRVEGLLSLGQLFPNLTLIRGRELFNDYALIVYEMHQLLELGLRSLTTIMRGSVRLEKNPKLCYTHTINWEKITGRSTGHFINENGPSMCPGSETCRGCDDNLCWSSKHCQKLPSPYCHPECLGGCNNLTGLCFRCKHLIEGNNCVTNCSEGKIEFPDANQCITEEVCSKMFRGRGWTWEGKCVKHCPKGHKEAVVESNRTCVFCGKDCPVECLGAEISTMAEAQKLRGCNIVNGSLFIRFSGEHTDDVMKEMEDNLGDIREIHGYLKIYRSITITSLSFFKSLTVIHGRHLENSQYSLVVYEMNNLQTLFNTPNKEKLTLKEGTIFFHYNAKLCLTEIYELKTILKVNITSFGVSTESNGFMATCHSVILETESQVLGKSNVSITWDRFTPNTTSQNIMGYHLFYLEEPEDAVATDYGRDSCFIHPWKSVLIPETNKPDLKKLVYNLTDLSPSTRYAFYVETANSEEESGEIEVASKNGQSRIKYFKTEMDIPSMPVDVSTISTSNDTVTIYWSLDPEYKGTITRYVIEHSIQYDELALLDMRNYCYNPLEFTPAEVRNRTKEMEDARPPSKDGKNNCRCTERSSDAAFWENYIMTQTAPSGLEIHQLTGQTMLCKNQQNPERAFDIINAIKCGNIDYNLNSTDANETDGHQRKSRHATDFKVPREFVEEPTPRPPVQNVTMNNQFHAFSTEFSVNSNSNVSLHNYTLYGLKHYSKYIIFMAACKGKRDVDCGPISMAVQRTAAITTADDIKNLKIEIMSKTSVDVLWDEPKEPNGAIVSYTVEYKRNEVANFKPVLECVTRLQHASNNHRFSLHRLHPGRYSIRVRATSLAGDGNYADYQHFSLPVKGRGFNYSLFFGLGTACLVSIIATWCYYQKKNPNCSLDQRPLVFNEYGARYVVRDQETGREGVELIEF